MCHVGCVRRGFGLGWVGMCVSVDRLDDFMYGAEAGTQGALRGWVGHACMHVRKCVCLCIVRRRAPALLRCCLPIFPLGLWGLGGSNKIDRLEWAVNRPSGSGASMPSPQIPIDTHRSQPLGRGLDWALWRAGCPTRREERRGVGREKTRTTRHPNAFARSTSQWAAAPIAKLGSASVRA